VKRICSFPFLRFLCELGGFAWKKAVSRKAAKNAKEESKKKNAYRVNPGLLGNEESHRGSNLRKRAGGVME